MFPTSTRLAIGFAAGALSHLLFQGAYGSLLYAAGALPSLPFSLAPVPPLGVPRTVSLGFWAAAWALLYVLLERRLTASFGRVGGGLVFGLAPLLGHWFVVPLLKGTALGSGFHLAVIPIEVGFHAAYGIGVALLFAAGLHALARPMAPGAIVVPR